MIYLIAAAVAFAIFMGALYGYSHQDWDAFIRAFIITVIIEFGMTVIGFLLWLGVQEYVGS